jgi:hypothetical protein
MRRTVWYLRKLTAFILEVARSQWWHLRSLIISWRPRQRDDDDDDDDNDDADDDDDGHKHDDLSNFWSNALSGQHSSPLIYSNLLWLMCIRCIVTNPHWTGASYNAALSIPEIGIDRTTVQSRRAGAAWCTCSAVVYASNIGRSKHRKVTGYSNNNSSFFL